MFLVSIQTDAVCSVSSEDKTHSEVVTTTGNSAQLSCGSQLFDEYDIVWLRYPPFSEATYILSYYSVPKLVRYHNGYSESDYTFNKTDSSLTVHNVTLTDAGCYRCKQNRYFKTVKDAVSLTTSSSKCKSAIFLIKNPKHTFLIKLNITCNIIILIIFDLIHFLKSV